MAKVTFFLKNKKSSKTLIYLFFQFNHFEIVKGKKKFKVLKYSTNEKINPNHWDYRAHRAKQTKAFVGYQEFNTRLRKFEEGVEEEYRKMLNDGIQPTPDSLRSVLNERFGRDNPAPEEKVSLMEFVENFIADSKSGQRLTDSGKKFSGFTVKGYTTTYNYLSQFQEIYKRKIDFETIDLDFYNDFLAFYNKNNKSINTIGKHIKNLKVFMRAAAEKGLHNNFAFQNRRFKTVEEVTDSIYLNDEELLKIYNLDLSGDKRLERVRDLFIIGCYTGLRFADYHRFSTDNIRNFEKGSIIYVRTQKTSEPVAMPLKWMLHEIIKKYEGNIPKPFTNQEMNRTLKKIGKLAEINDPVSHTLTKGGLRVETMHEKYELIVTHTARRSFATNMYLAGIPTISIMKITGHRTERSFMKYIKISQEDNAIKLMEHPYFSQQKPVKLKMV